MKQNILMIIWISLLCLGATDVLAGECRNDETGEISEFDGPCPDGWHPTGGWVGDDTDGDVGEDE